MLGVILLGLIACSSGDKKKQEEESLSSDVEKSMADSEGEEIFAEIELEEEETAPGVTEMVEEDTVVVSEGPKREIVSKVTIKELGDYQVKKGDTLLYIAFKIYGDYRKWRQVLSVNPGLNPGNIMAGMIIRYEIPMEKFNYNPQGVGHLIVRGETLGTISMLHYGTSKRWKDIHRNNQDMIMNPDLIFAGFTLYYIPDTVAKVTP
jgi:nucleoid-associated protein YgaU